MKKLYVIKFSNDLAYLEEICYNSYQERYQKTLGISPDKMYELSELEEALEKIHILNQ